MPRRGVARWRPRHVISSAMLDIRYAVVMRQSNPGGIREAVRLIPDAEAARIAGDRSAPSAGVSRLWPARYPAFRTSRRIDDLRSRLRLPVTLLYLGAIVGDYGLRYGASRRAKSRTSKAAARSP
jgi:hypothetical protein